jgi:enoyl-CoA hydratase
MSDLLVERRQGVALVTLNRPEALNALTAAMCREFDGLLAQWAADPAVTAVVVKGAGDRAFCAGGDIRAIYDAAREGRDDGDFFRDEYRLVRRVHRFPKPYISLIDGIVMGGGAGISINGRYRIVTERTMFAMPETAIGIFPDVGATRFLPSCPGKIGLYLGLTGARLKAADMIMAGIATHYVPRDRLDALVTSLAAQTEAAAAIARVAADPGPSTIAAQREDIDRCFGGESVAEILARLRAEDSDWAHDAVAACERSSPTSLKITMRQLAEGAADIEHALTLEFRMTRHILAAHDFFEGIRAQIVDRDRAPKWSPATLAEVTPTSVARYFEPTPSELWFE